MHACYLIQAQQSPFTVFLLITARQKSIFQAHKLNKLCLYWSACVVHAYSDRTYKIVVAFREAIIDNYIIVSISGQLIIYFLITYKRPAIKSEFTITFGPDTSIRVACTEER